MVRSRCLAGADPTALSTDMIWQEDTPSEQFSVPDDVQDLVFSIQCRELPVDHAHSLSMALLDALPWLADDERVAIHTVHVAGSQNGWERPEEKLILSRRTKMHIRVPRELIERVQQELVGKTLNIGGHDLTVGDAKTKSLSKLSTLFSRYVVLGPGEDEDETAFLQRVVFELKSRGIRVRKALCGKTLALDTPEGPIQTRSLMLAELSPEDSVQLQQEGLGSHRKMGCGIFIPHKGIEAVKTKDSD